ncbi:MAG: two-component sensor histidine kinase, partial [Thermodesulfobacteriota bacterium]|nr:two-component sensor histidine kinase [Thermodesulfobacteriota bacterium]
MKSPGIHARIVVTALVLICGSTILLGMLGIRFSMEFVEKRFHEHLELMGKYLAVNAEVGILVNDRAWLKKLAR